MINRLKELRQEYNYTQKEIADFLGVTPKAVSFYELGQRQIPNEALVKLANKFSVSTDYLLGRTEKRNGIVIGDYTFTPIEVDDPKIKELAELFNKLSKEDQARILDFTKRMAEKK